MSAPVIKADFVKPMPVPSRKVLQLTFEVPEEQADHAMAVLGGYPQSGENRWCGIALLDPTLTAEEKMADRLAQKYAPELRAEPEKPKGGPLSQQAGMLCATPAFRSWLVMQPWTSEWPQTGSNDAIADIVRWKCGINSRAEIDNNLTAAQTWKELTDAYYESQRGQSVEQMEGMQR